MRRVLPAAAAVSLLLLIAGCGSSQDEGTSTNSTTLTVYSSLPLQGPGAERSQQIVDGEKLALAQSGGQIGRYTINFRSLDDARADQGWDPDASVKAARQAVQDRSTIALIGDADAGATALSLPITNASGVLQVTPSASYAGFTGPDSATEGTPEKYLPSGRSSFARLVPGDAVQAGLIARTLHRAGCRRLTVVQTRSGFDISLARLVGRAAAREGLAIADAVQIPRNAKDAKAREEMAATVVRERPGCVVVSAGVTERPAPLFDALHRADPALTLVAPLALSDSSFADDLGSGAAAATLVVGPDRRALAAPFAQVFRRAYGRAPGPWAAHGYEAMRLVLHAVSAAGEAGNDRRAVAERLRGAVDRRSVLGVFSMRPSGDSTLARLGVYRVRGGVLR